MSSRFIDWLTSLTAKSTTIDGSEQVHIGSSGLSQKATTKDLVSYTSQNLAQTWNAGTVFTAIKMNVTDTASSASSLLMDLQVGGASKFYISKTGKSFATDGLAYSFINAPNTGIGRIANDVTFYSGATPTGRLFSTGFAVSSNAILGFCSAEDIAISTPDLALARDDANTLAQRNGTNAQEWRVYGTYTDASNYRRLTYKMSTAGVAELKPEGAGTGASGNVLHISGLPTSNPGPGILWNDGGTITVGT